MLDLGVNLGSRASTDATAAKGIASRRGLGKVRHVEVSQLWVQDKVMKGEIEVRKVDGKTNVADALTKHVGNEDVRVHMFRTSQYVKSGRHALAPEVAQ